MNIKETIMIALALNESRSMDQYLAAGRSYKHLPDADLVPQWEAAVGRFLPWPPSNAVLLEEMYLRHEAELRGLELPNDAARKVADFANNQLASVAQDPELKKRMKTAAEKMIDEVEQFTRAPKN